MAFSKSLTIKNKDKLIEKIKQFTEFQIWGDQHDDTFFEYLNLKKEIIAL